MPASSTAARNVKLRIRSPWRWGDVLTTVRIVPRAGNPLPHASITSRIGDHDRSPLYPPSGPARPRQAALLDSLVPFSHTATHSPPAPTATAGWGRPGTDPESGA